MTMKDAIKALMDFYAEHGKDRPMDYTYGYMDALAVLRELAEREAK